MKGLFVALNGPAPEGMVSGTGTIAERGFVEGIGVAVDEDKRS